MRCPNCGHDVPKKELSEEVRQACAAWRYVLERFKAPRALIPGEDLHIGRQISSRGLEAVLLAFRGALAEPKTKEFDPAKFISLNRVFNANNFERFVTLGAQDKSKKEVAKRREMKLAGDPPPITTTVVEPKVIDPERQAKVQAIMKGILDRMN